MTGRVQGKTSRSLALALLAAAFAAITLACGTDYFEIPIETPIQPKLDVSAFQRVLVAGSRTSQLGVADSANEGTASTDGAVGAGKVADLPYA